MLHITILDELMRAAAMKEIWLLVDIIVCLVLIKHYRGVPMDRLIRGVLMNISAKIAHILTLRNGNHNVPSMNLLDTTIICSIV